VFSLTQQELINRLNQLTIHYNLTWADIKYDADKAIAKINSYLGTEYPKMSDILLSPEDRYVVRVDGVDHPYFPEEHIHSVIIPHIVMEVLARDEEFTTVYNKYMVELEDGLFNMFQKEFNKVPLAFRQQPDQGVFFASDSAQGIIYRNNLDNLPVFKFRVHYHINNDQIVLSSGTSTQFIQDTRAYLYNDTAIVKGWNIDLLSYDGATAYHFLGWTRNKSQVTEEAIQEGAILTIKSDVHLYAKWSKVSTLTVSPLGEVSIKDLYKPSLTHLVIPDMINNVPARSIASNFILDTDSVRAKHADNLQTIILPRYLSEIKQQAFNGFKGTSIALPETQTVEGFYTGVTIRNAAFQSTPNLTSIILPLNVMTIEAGAFPAVANKNLIIYPRVLELNKPAGWANLWYAGDNESIFYTVNVVWGYNG
jgi:hypothetical protein